MQLTPDQERIKSVAQKNKADARTLMRIYMMNDFLNQLRFRSTHHQGWNACDCDGRRALRSTMDIDTSLKNQNLSAEDALRIVNEIKNIDLGDGVTFEIKEVSNIMDEMEYPGIRFTTNAVMGSSLLQ